MASPKVDLIPCQEGDDFDDDDFYNTESPVKKDSALINSSSNTIEPPVPTRATLSPIIPGLNIEPVSALEAPLAAGNGLIEVEVGQMQILSDPAVSEEKASLDNQEEKAPINDQEEKAPRNDQEEKAPINDQEEKAPIDHHEGKALPDAIKIEQKEISLKLEVDQQDDGAAATEAPNKKSALDAEFLLAAEANKENEDAEWRFDSSDAESSESSETDSSDDSSEEHSDEADSDEDDSDEEDSDDSDILLTPAEQARMLMLGMAEDGPIKSAPLRTHNEMPDEIKAKPTLDITPDMKITQLGNVQSVINNFILVAAITSGKYAVLEAESVLCLQDRTVLGVVHETIGQVQNPIYLIGYNTAEEAKETGVTKGTKVFYVDAHSKFLFTGGIQNEKGTDASNVFDEPVPEEDMAFSDDEKEHAFKRKKKANRKEQAAWETRNGTTPANSRHPQRPTGIAANSIQQRAYPTTMSYDDDDADSDPGMYRPLARPDNLHEMMARGAPEERLPRSITNGRGRGRGDRQWVDRGRGARGRGGRGRGNDARAYSQRHDNARRGRGGHGYRGQDQRNSLPARPEQSASTQSSAFPWIPPMINGVPIPPPIGMPFPFNQQGMPAFPMPPPVSGSLAQNNFQNGNSPAQFQPDFVQLFAKIQQQATQQSQQSYRPMSQQAQAQPFPQWSQAPIPPPVAPHAWSGMQTQQHQQHQHQQHQHQQHQHPQHQHQQQMPQQAGPSTAQLQDLLRMINAHKPKQ